MTFKRPWRTGDVGNRLYSCLSDCSKREWHDVKYLCGLKIEPRENERGWRSDTCRYTCPSLSTSPLVAVTANQILAPPSDPHPSARDVRNVSTQRTKRCTNRPTAILLLLMLLYIQLGRCVNDLMRSNASVATYQRCIDFRQNNSFHSSQFCGLFTQLEICALFYHFYCTVQFLDITDVKISVLRLKFLRQCCREIVQYNSLSLRSDVGA